MTGFSLRALLTTAASILVACGGVPTAPVDEGVHFLYIQGHTVLAPGETLTLAAYEMRSGQAITDVTTRVRWSTSDSSVVTIEQGLLRAVRAGEVSISADLAGTSTTTSVHVVVPSGTPDVITGYYAGTLTYTGCTRIAGEGPSPCRDWVGRNFPLELNVAEQNGARAAGSLRVLNTTEGAVVGYVEIGGDISLSGMLRVPDSGHSMAYMVRRLRGPRVGARLAASGSADYALIGGFGPQLVRHTFDVEATLK